VHGLLLAVFMVHKLFVDKGRHMDRHVASPTHADVELFQKIKSLTTVDDRKSLLSIQEAVRDRHGEYNYLEIGSHKGGSLQPHLVDPSCVKIYSIDKRPLLQPDERGPLYPYPNNSTQAMLKSLEEIDREAVSKIEYFDGDISDISPGFIVQRPELCFIDGEHTRSAVTSDFEHCMRYMASNGVIILHDANIIFRAILDLQKQLKRKKIMHVSFAMRSAIYIFDFGTPSILGNKWVQQQLLSSYGIRCLFYQMGLLASKGYYWLRNFVKRTLRFRTYKIPGYECGKSKS
jgi:hypothetical protein